MRERRQFARYDVSKFPQLAGGTHNAPIGERLMTMSIGGCGFWAPTETCNFMVGEKVDVALHCEGMKWGPLKVKGEVLYILPHPFETQVGRFYGVRFLEDCVENVATLMEQLDVEFRAGRIQMA